MQLQLKGRSELLLWEVILLVVLVAWLACSLFLDGVVMPTLYGAGMMQQAGFASAGYALFEVFNHLELLAGAIVFTGFLGLEQPCWPVNRRHCLIMAAVLFIIPWVYTYGLTPQMGSLGMVLNELGEPLGDRAAASLPQSMQMMHWGYWSLELFKVGMALALLRQLFQGVVQLVRFSTFAEE